MLRTKLTLGVMLGLGASLFGFGATMAQGVPQPPQLEEALIEEAVTDLYIRGLRTRDFDLIRYVCLPEAVLMNARGDGTLAVTTLDEWSRRFDPANPPFRHLQAVVVKVDRVGTAAQVRIRFVLDGDTEVTDFLNMLKVNGRWRIANIIDY